MGYGGDKEETSFRDGIESDKTFVEIENENEER